MLKDEKLKKMCGDFSLLKEDQQDYILGILQALVFANNAHSQSAETGNSGQTPLSKD